MSEKLNRDDFAKYKGTKFKAYLNSDEATEFELVDVSELRVIDRSEVFSLVFHAPATALIVTGMAKMEHEELGTLDIGISPFGQDENATKYEALFSSLIGEPDAPTPTEM